MFGLMPLLKLLVRRSRPKKEEMRLFHQHVVVKLYAQNYTELSFATPKYV
jgi:hypothetical protein